MANCQPPNGVHFQPAGRPAVLKLFKFAISSVPPGRSAAAMRGMALARSSMSISER